MLKSFFLRRLLRILTLGIGDCNISFSGVSIQTSIKSRTSVSVHLDSLRHGFHMKSASEDNIVGVRPRAEELATV
jgi:hypothetical protein